MKKILIVNTHLRKGGGVSTSLVNLLNELSKLNLYEIDLLVFSSFIDKSWQIPKNVNIKKSPFWLDIWYSTRQDYNKFSVKRLLWIIIHLIGKIIQSDKIINYIISKTEKMNGYDVAIAFSNDIPSAKTNLGCNDFVVKCVDSKKKISWIHNDSHRLGFNYEYCKKVYSKFDTIVNVSYACKNMFDEIIPEYIYKSKVVYNMFDINRIQELSKEENPYNNNKFNLVTVARLDNKQKRIDRVIDCCKRLKTICDFEWHIIGDGPDKEYLINTSKTYDLENYIVFHGMKYNPYPYIKNADIFVQTSDYEAYSMVLLESLTLKTPVICTNYESAKESIDNGKNGILVNKDEKSIFYSIKNIIENKKIINDMVKYINNNEVSNKLSIEQCKDVIGV